MSIRSALNQSTPIVIGVVVLLVALAAWVTYRNVAPPPVFGREAYFTDDDGKTWFEGKMEDYSPMDHNGKTAYRAYIYKCADGKPFVGFMEKTPEDLVALMKKAKSNPDSITNQEKGKLMMASQMKQVKKPGEEKWRQAGPVGQIIACPDGKPAKSALEIPE